MRKFPWASKSHSITLSIDHSNNASLEMEVLRQRVLEVLKGYYGVLPH